MFQRCSSGFIREQVPKRNKDRLITDAKMEELLLKKKMNITSRWSEAIKKGNVYTRVI